MGPDGVRDPESVRTREELAEALTRLRESAGLTVRQLAQQSGVPQGTIGSWSAGHHVPTKATEPMVRKLLGACGVGPPGQDAWLAAIGRVREATGRRIGGEPPYLGLRSFRESDADRFFGRDELTEQLAAQVSRTVGNSGPDRIVLVIGASGSGKSSLLRAGLVPALRRAAIEVSFVLPGRHPVESLEAVPDSAGVVVVDQFEEVWTLCAEETERQRFFDRLGRSDATAVIVLGLRADFFARAAAEPVLLPALNARSTVVGPLTAEALRRIIVEPARSGGYDVQPELVNLLLGELQPPGSEAAHDIGALPLLSHALLETWRRAGRNILTVADYQAAGGIGGAVEQRAEQLYRLLSEHHRHSARRLFLRLVNVGDQTYTRRRVRRSELLFDDATDETIEQFAQGRLLTVEEQTVSLSHEALIGAWGRLTAWMNEDRDGLILHRGLTVAAQHWADSGREPSTLLGPARLVAIRAWAEQGDHERELNLLEREFLTASSDHDRRAREVERGRRRRLQWLVVTLAMLLAVAITAAMIAVGQRADARLARDQAVSRQVAGEAIRLRDTDPALAAQLALAAYRINPTMEARSAVMDASAVHTPVRLAGPAGDTLVTSGPENAVLVWAADGKTALLSTGAGDPQLIATPLPAMTSRLAMALSTGTALLARASSTTIELWDVRDWNAPARVAALEVSAPRSLAFGPDGRTLIAGTDGAAVRRWRLDDPAHPGELPSLELPGGQAILAVDATGKRLAAGGKDRSLRVWDIATPEPALLLDVGPSVSLDNVQALRFSPDGSMLAAGTRASQVLRWRFDRTRAPLALPALTGFTSYVNDLAFSPDGTRLAAASSDTSTRIWSLADDSLELTLPNPGVVGSVRFAGNTTVVTGSVDGTTRLWPIPSPALAAAHAKVEFISVDKSGQTLLVGAGRGETRSYLWDLSEPRAPKARQALDLPTDDSPTGAVALAPNGSLAAVGAASGKVYLWDLTAPAAPRYLTAVQAVPSLVAALFFIPDGTKLVAGSQDHPVISVWDVAKPFAPQQLCAIDTGSERPRNVTVDHTSTVLAVGTNTDLVQLWDFRDPTSPHRLPSLTGFDGTVNRVALSPVAPLLAVGGHEPTVRLFNVADPTNPRLVAQLQGPIEPAYALAFSPDGHMLARGGNGGIWLWDITAPQRPRVIANVTADQGRINDTRFVGDGLLLAGAGEKRTVHLWATDPDQAAAAVCLSGSTPLTTTEWNRHIPDYVPRTLCPH